MQTRIAMWSGPRNISTALMRSFGNRPDCFVTDEPLYAFYLDQTGLDHPGRAETLRHHEADWRKVVERLVGELPDGKTVWYQKHMAHHLLPQVDRGWLASVHNAFLIREPREMLTSLIEFILEPTAEDTGLPRQVEIFELVRGETGRTPPVIDGRDVLENPRRVLAALCERLGIPWTDAMLSWPAGRRATDGAWAEHWYEKVWRTTGFGTYRRKSDAVPESLHGVLDRCEELYQRLAVFRLGASSRDSGNADTSS